MASNTLISHHFEIKSEAPVVRNPEVIVKHQPGSAAIAIYEPRCGTRRHVCFFFLYSIAVGIQGGIYIVVCVCVCACEI